MEGRDGPAWGPEPYPGLETSQAVRRTPRILALVLCFRPQERTCTFVPVTMHALQRVYRARSERARAFLRPRAAQCVGLVLGGILSALQIQTGVSLWAAEGVVSTPRY
jgi:hypothetical protein